MGTSRFFAYKGPFRGVRDSGASPPRRVRRLRLESLENRCLLSGDAGGSLLQVISMTPLPGAKLAEPPSQITLTFNRAVSPDSLLMQHLLLEGSGGDGTFGDGNETTIRPTGLSFVGDVQVVVELSGVTLPSDRYRLQLGGNERHTSLVFDGVNDLVSSPLNIAQDSASPGVTFEAWVNPSSLGSGRHHVISTDNSGFDWSILREGDQWFVFTGEASRPAGFAVVEGRWQHLAAVFEPGRGVTFYMDGQESFLPYIGYDTSDSNVTIGRNPSYSEFFAGAIDEVRVWSGARTAEQIRANMHQPLSGSEAGLLAYWKFDDGTGQWAMDSSPNGRNGLLGGSVAVGSNDPLWRSELDWPESADGAPLDGEFTGSFPSGDGTAGGTFAAEFDVLDATPPWIVKSSPAGYAVGPVDHVVVTFSEPIDPSSWDAGDVQLLGASGAPLAISGVTQLDGNRYEISFPAQTALGSYALTVLPGVADLGGNPLDQNRNGVPGEAGDAYAAGFTIVNANQYYFEDFSEALGGEWSFPLLTGEGRIQFTTDFSVDPGGRGLQLDSSNPSGDSVKDLNEAVLALDLSAMGNAVLTFHYLKMGGTSTAIGDVHVTGAGSDRPPEALGDGVSISNDGATWYRIKSVFSDEVSRAGTGIWSLEEYLLQSEVNRINAAFGAGLTLNGTVFIKFSQYGARPFTQEGWVIDDVCVSGLPEYVHTSLDHDVLYRMNVPGESPQDLVYRVALVGDVTPETPIFVSVHGSGSIARKYSHTWLQGALRGDSGIDSLVLVSPEYVLGGRYQGSSNPSYAHLSWNINNDTRADMALLGIVDQLAALGLGDASEIYLYGHSGGGQFTERFTWAHPDRVAVGLVSAAGARCFPDEYERYELGIGLNRERPAPPGVDLAANLPEVLDTRLIYRVGENDREVIEPDFQSYPMANYQGLTRIERALNMYEAMSDIAPSTGRSSTSLDHQVVIMEGIGHSGTSDPVEAAEFYRMMFAPKVEPNVFVYPRFVAEPTADPSRATLPAHVDQWKPGETLYMELWVTTTSEAGIQSATTDLFIDSEVLTPLNITYGALFPDDRSGFVDTGTNWVRGVGGATGASGVGVGTFALLARVEVAVKSEQTLRQLVALPQAGEWTLGDGTEGAVRMLPLPYAERTIQGAEDLFGQVFEDQDLDGALDAQDAGVADWTVRLLDASGAELAVPYGVAAADFAHGAGVSEAIPQATLSVVGTGNVGLTVLAQDRTINGASRRVFCMQRSDGYGSWWGESLGVALRADFASPVWQVDVRAMGGSGFSRARMQAFDAQGNQIGESFTSNLAGYAVETFGVSTAQPQIAYVIVTGVNGSLRLDQLSILSSVQTTTDAQGHFEFSDVPAGTYQIAVDVPEGWELVRPINDGAPIVVSSESRRFLEGGAVAKEQPIPGDATGDGVVDINDARRLALNWLKTGVGWSDGDFNGDNIVDDLDASILAANWHYIPPEQAPQPTEPPATEPAVSEPPATQPVIAGSPPLIGPVPAGPSSVPRRLIVPEPAKAAVPREPSVAEPDLAEPVVAGSARFIGPMPAGQSLVPRRLIEPARREDRTAAMLLGVLVDESPSRQAAAACDAVLASQYGPERDEPSALDRQRLAWSYALARPDHSLQLRHRLKANPLAVEILFA